MTDLKKSKCIPCEGGIDPLTDTQIEEYKHQVPRWTLVREDSKKLKRAFEFKDFRQALDFTDKVGELAEAEGHHPVITTEWGKVTIVYWTHAISGLHQNDFIMAAKTDDLYNQ